MNDEDHIVAGSLMNNIQAAVAKFISEARAAAIHSKQVKPGSAKM